MAEATHYFPPDFLWGTATAAHQVEGNNNNNNWSAWEQEKGRIFADQASGKACQWWAGRAEEDVARMAELNTNAHRLSVEWSRVEPEPGRWNNDAIDRYRAILRTMRDAGIQPMITLHHFTEPLWMVEQGGWLNEESVTWFRRFVKKITWGLADLCDTWCTINEPSVYAGLGYFSGRYPPGHQNLREYFAVIHNLLLAHAAAYEQIHDVQITAQVGLAKNMAVWRPRRAASPLDLLITRLLDHSLNRLILDALATGRWQPAIGRRVQLDKVKGTLDWIGLNYYYRYDAAFSLKALSRLGISYTARPGQPQGPERWGELYPDGLLELIGRLYRQLKLPIYITENGIPDEFDNNRPVFLIKHLRRLWAALNFNWPVKGYYFWSLVDNFEWADGYDPRFRFGLYGVDFETQARTLRQSGRLYAEIAGTHSLSSDMVRRYAPQIFDDLFPGGTPEELRGASTR
jgi:beta-glucosidase